MQFTMKVDLRHTNVVAGMLQRAAAKTRSKLNDRLNQIALQQLEPRATAAPAFDKPVNSCCSAIQ